MPLINSSNDEVKVGETVVDQNGVVGKIEALSPPTIKVLWPGATHAVDVLPSTVKLAYRDETDAK
jgi:cell shape-determining protein MreC